MAISEIDIKLLWGRAAGRCSNPACRTDLTALLQDGSGYVFGEMAHVIARQPAGPRGSGKGGSDKYENLVLLCPTCHTKVDKQPDIFPEQMLLGWKSTHEAFISRQGSEFEASDWKELAMAVSQLLSENRSIFTELGPKSEAAELDPNSNLHAVWSLRKLDTIVPNNRKIVNMVEGNRKHIDLPRYNAFAAFKNHALAFEQNQYGRPDRYPLFPEEFEKAFQP